MGELIRTMNWAQTALGEPFTWPDSLKSALSICLNSGFPIAIYWGQDFTLFYNDAWSSIPGDKHPRALGKPGATACPEIWQGLEAAFDSVFKNGKSVHSKDALLPIHRFGYTEECYFDYTLSPIIAADGTVGGVFNAVIETTYRVINERRNQILHTLLKLRINLESTPVIDVEMKVLTDAKLDLPFSFIYTDDTTSADKLKIAASTGIPEPALSSLDTLLKKALEKGTSLHVKNLSDYFEADIISGWPEPCTEALIVPLATTEKNINSCLVAGISARKKLDTEYRQFIESVAVNISTAITKSHAFEQEQKNKLRIVESEDRFRSMMDQAPVAMAVFRGKELKMTKANQAMLSIINKTDAVIGQKLLDVFPEIANGPFLEIINNVYANGQAYFGYDTDFKLQRNGVLEEAYFDFSFSPLIEEGEITGVLEVVSEVTERVKAKQEIAESEALFRGITSASPTALWITDEVGNITYVNKTWINWTGKPLETHLGKGWLDAVCEEDVAQAYASFITDFLQQRYHESHFRILHTNGQERSVVCTGNPHFDGHQKFKGFIGACVDITEQKQLQRQKDNFLGVASHELKTPVTSIKAYAQVLEMMFRRDGDTQKAEMLGKLNKQVNRLSSLIGDLLDVTKIHTGRMQFNETEFNFNDLAEEVIEDIQHTSLKHQFKKQLDFKGIIKGDKERISQVITNLLINAIKYSPDANEIIIYTHQKDGEMQFCVQDFGIGISANKKDMVFEQFYRVSGTKEHTFPGLGLGLYISSEIIKRLHGRIWVTSVEGKGSTFCFSLPLNC